VKTTMLPPRRCREGRKKKEYNSEKGREKKYLFLLFSKRSESNANNPPIPKCKDAARPIPAATGVEMNAGAFFAFLSLALFDLSKSRSEIDKSTSSAEVGNPNNNSDSTKTRQMIVEDLRFVVMACMNGF